MGGISKAFESVTKPFGKVFEWGGDIVAPDIDTSGQERAIREQARQQAQQAAESARQAAEQQGSAQQREQLLRQRDEESDIDDEEAEVRVGDGGDYDTQRRRRQQFLGSPSGGEQGASIRI